MPGHGQPGSISSAAGLVFTKRACVYPFNRTCLIGRGGEGKGLEARRERKARRKNRRKETFSAAFFMSRLNFANARSGFLQEFGAVARRDFLGLFQEGCLLVGAEFRRRIPLHRRPVTETLNRGVQPGTVVREPMKQLVK